LISIIAGVEEHFENNKNEEECQVDWVMGS